MKRIRIALAGGAVAVAAFAPFAPSASAVACAPDFQVACDVLALVCQTLDNPKLGILRCAPLG
jgi:homospermidine synthase